MSTIKILIADSKDACRNNIIRLLAHQDSIVVAGEVKDGNEALEKIKELQPHVVLLDIDLPVIDGLQLTEMLVKEYPTVQPIVTSTKSESVYFRQALKSGAKDFLTWPFNDKDLIDAITNVYTKWLKDRPDFDAESNEAKVVTFFATKGGVGRTTLATNVAVALAAKGKRTLLIDASLQFGDIALALNIKPKNTIIDLVQSGEFAADDIERRLTRHEESGLQILAAPITPASADMIRPEHLSTIIKTLKPLYQFIIIDMPAAITEKELAILDATTLLFLVATLEITSLNNTRKSLKILTELGHGPKVKLLLNKNVDDPTIGITKEAIETHLGVSVYAVVPSEPVTTQASLNRGEAFVLKQPMSLISRNIIDIAEKLVGPGKKPANTNKSAILRIKDLLFGN